MGGYGYLQEKLAEYIKTGGESTSDYFLSTHLCFLQQGMTSYNFIHNKMSFMICSIEIYKGSE